jgi:antitoxin (DNA-binding transcriptional repressor) of toxin-antitoxin stability system
VRDTVQVSIRDLRLKFPEIRRHIEEYGEVVVTDNGVPSYVIKNIPKEIRKDPAAVDYWSRLVSQQPNAMSTEEAQALLDENRGDR